MTRDESSIMMIGETSESTDLCTADDRKDFLRLDGVVSKGMATFVDVGRALMEIRNRKLYRKDYKTFEDYVEQRHELSERRAYYLMDASEVVDDLKKLNNCSETQPILPSNEGQCRELICVPSENRPGVWESVLDHHEESGESITAKLIRKFTEPFRKAKEEVEPEEDTLPHKCV